MQSTLNSPAASTRSLTRADRIVLTRAATGLKPAEKLLLRSLVDFMGNSPECWPSLSRLAAEVGVSVRHVRRMLRSLEAAGWISTRYRFRPDRSQASCIFTWSKVPDTHVRPPRTSTSALEKDIGKFNSNTLCRTAECDLVSQANAPAAAPVLPVELPAAAAEVVLPVESQIAVCADTIVEVKAIDFQTGIPAIPDSGPVVHRGSSKPASTSTTPAIPFQSCDSAIPATRSSKPSPKFIVIDGSKFLDIKEAERVYHGAVAAKLLNSGTVDRLAFFACWCAIAAKLRAGVVRHPERMMRFLLDNRKAMSAYPDHAAELKARDAVRFLFPEKRYNPHG